MRNNSQEIKNSTFSRNYSYKFFSFSRSQLHRSEIQIELVKKKHPNKNKCCWKWVWKKISRSTARLPPQHTFIHTEKRKQHLNLSSFTVLWYSQFVSRHTPQLVLVSENYYLSSSGTTPKMQSDGDGIVMQLRIGHREKKAQSWSNGNFWQNFL